MPESRTRPQLILVALLAAVPMARAATPVSAVSPPQEHYRVMDGKVDRLTYTGWQVFEENCAQCHGQGAAGTQNAPSLVERISYLSPDEFRVKVMTRYFISLPLSDAVAEGGEAMREAMEEEVESRRTPEFENSKMPRWQSNPDVRDHIDSLYAYLTARADGVLGAGVPEVFDDAGESAPADEDEPHP